MLVRAGLANTLGLDFRGAFLPAAHAVLRGASPYSAIGSHALAVGKGFLYPPLSAYLLAPFTLLPTTAAYIFAVLLVAATVPAALFLVGVRDWRCYAAAFLWMPTIVGIQTANLTLPMVFGLALVWRYREHRVVVALVSAVVVALKLFFWPLLVWLLATRRYRGAVIALGASAVLVLLPWAGIGFVGLRGYPHLLATVSRYEGPQKYSVAALVHSFSVSWTVSIAVETLLGAVLLLRLLLAGRMGRDREAFALTILAILVFTPLFEMHYFSALLIVVALYRPRFGVVWLVPLLIWGAPATAAGSTLQLVHVLVVAAAVVALAMSNRASNAMLRIGRRWAPLLEGRGRRRRPNPAAAAR